MSCQIFIQSPVDLYYIIYQDSRRLSLFKAVIFLVPSVVPGILFRKRLHIVVLFCILTIPIGCL